MQRRSGFTLVEMSITLVIIALLVAGVLVGKELINSAQRRSAVKAVIELETAMQAFRLKYNCVVGDCLQATSFGFGASGNGDGRISPYVPPLGIHTVYEEGWSNLPTHLFTAGLAEHFALTVQDRNIRKLSNGAYLFSGAMGLTLIQSLGVTNTFALLMTSYFYETCTGLCLPNSDLDVRNGLSPIDAMSIDQTLDDGKPSSGRIRAIGAYTDTGILLYTTTSNGLPSSGAAGDGVSCITNTTPAEYNLANGDIKACGVVIAIK